MISRRILAAVALLCAFAMPAYAQKTKAALTTEINTNLATNGKGQLTAALLRSTVIDIVNSYYDLGGSGALGTPSSGLIGAGVTLGGVTLGLGSDATGDVYYNNGGILTRLPKGSNGQALEMVSGLPTWASVSGTGTVNTAGAGLSLTGGGSTLGINYANNNIWTGTNAFSGDTYFGGSPWADVKSGTHGCAAAVGNNSTDDTAAIQCYLNYMYTTNNGGFVFFPPGNYKVTSTLTVKGTTTLAGAGDGVSELTGNADFTLLAFDNTVSNGGMRDIFIAGYQNTGATYNTVTVANNVPIVFRNCHIWGGTFALSTGGTDGYIDNCFILGWGTTGGDIVSTGANWYQRVKLDTSSNSVAYAFVQNTCFNASPCENHFNESDFSGNYGTASIQVNDAYSFLTVASSVLSSPVKITAGKATIFVGNEFGSTTLVANSVGGMSISGSVGLVAITASGTATRSCAANINITC